MITHKYYNISEYTPSITSYFDLIRVMILYHPVEVLRNDSDVAMGIYIVGEQEHIANFIDHLQKIITKVEAALKWKKFRKKPNSHLHHVRAQFRSSKINLEILKVRMLILEDVVGFKLGDHSIRLEYIKYSTLKVYKKFYGR